MPLYPGRVAVPVLLLLASPTGIAAQNLSTCASKDPESEAASLCLYQLAEGTGPFREAAARKLEELRTAHPDRSWPALYAGQVRWLAGDKKEAEELYRRAIEIAAGRGQPRAELLARSSLCRILRDSGRMDEAKKEVERVNEIARHSRDPFLIAKAGILQASQWNAVGKLEESYALLGQIEPQVKADGSYLLTRDYLFALYFVAQQNGRLREAWLGCQRLAELAAANGDLKSEAAARSGMAKTRLDELSEAPEAGGREEVMGLARQALSASRAAKRPSQEASSLWLLGSLENGAEAVEHLERCFAVASTPTTRSYCRGALARKLAPSDPAAAMAAVDEALSLARSAGDVWSQTSAWHDRMRVSWATLPPSQALEDSFPALSAIESLRDLQEGSARQPGLFSTWAEDYYWLSGRLLETGDLERAFGVIERMRSRTLTDALGLSPAASPDFASLADVRAALAPDEALLSFQIAPWKDLAGDFGGGSWLLVSTRSGTRPHRLPDRTELRPAVSVFAGLIEARDGSEAEGAAALYRKLLAPALGELPAEVDRLVIVADDALHRLPFAVLRPGPEPLAERYEITQAPSATLWLHWRRHRPAPAPALALVLANPVTDLKNLPYALDEGESVKRHLGNADLRVREEASEAMLRGREPFGLLHFAAHARMDDMNPERSAIHLSDGVLQVGEIVELKLGGDVVVLSTCESASGEILRGEGVMGLARAFFQAGAHTVVASLWKLRDDDGAALFDRFYRHLGKGKSVAAALRAAQLDRMKDGAPAEAWAGVVVLGDGDRVPLPGGRPLNFLPWVLVLAVLSLLTALLIRLRSAGGEGASRRRQGSGR